jgi:hypothetical protein
MILLLECYLAQYLFFDFPSDASQIATINVANHIDFTRCSDAFDFVRRWLDRNVCDIAQRDLTSGFWFKMLKHHQPSAVSMIVSLKLHPHGAGSPCYG